MAPFPSPRERTVASALLLLSTEPPSLSPTKPSPSFCIDDVNDESIKDECKSNCSKESLVLSDSKSCSSSLTSDVVACCHEMKLKFCCFEFDDESIKDKCKSNCSKESLVLSDSKSCSSSLTSDVVACCHEMKLKVVRKSRSKSHRSSDRREMTSCKPAMMLASKHVSGITEASCSSAISSARSRCVSRGWDKDGLRREDSTTKHVGSAHMRHRAEAILRLLSGGCSSEVRIRQMLGDSPDTSKALRMLLKLEEIKRSGAGGRLDPYIYTIAQ